MLKFVLYLFSTGDMYRSLACNPIKMFGKERNKNNSFFILSIWVKAKESQYLYVIIKLWFLQFFRTFQNTRCNKQVF